MTEVELKARLASPAETEERVKRFARFVRQVDKSDQYWHGPDWRSSPGTRGFRLRHDGDRCIVTFKTKRLDAGIETNTETEFEVSAPDAFNALVARIGCEPYYTKRKTGTMWEYDGCTIELVTIEPIGHFIEIESLVDSDAPDVLALERDRILSVLGLAGVPASAMEARTYSEMLLGAAHWRAGSGPGADPGTST